MMPAKELHIALRCNEFPVTSQTFVLNHVLQCIDAGYKVSLHVDEIRSFENSKYQDVLSEYGKQINIVECIRGDTSFSRRFLSTWSHIRCHRTAAPFLRSLNPLYYRRSGINLRTYRSFSSLAAISRPDVTHAHFGHNGVALINARQCGLIDCPVITTFHGYDAYLGGSQELKFRRLYRDLFERGDAFVVNSHYLKGIVAALGCDEDKIHIIPNGIDTDLFFPKRPVSAPSKSDLKLITVGRLIPLKNQEIGIRALALLVRQGVEASYTLIGDGPELARLQMLADELGVSDSVHFRGALSSAEIRDELQNHHIFLMTSVEDSMGRAETQGVVTLEAQACGLPALVSGTGGTSETIVDGKSGFIYLNNDPRDIVDKINSLLEERCYINFSEVARKNIIENFDNNKTSKKIFGLYENLR